MNFDPEKAVLPMKFVSPGCPSVMTRSNIFRYMHTHYCWVDGIAEKMFDRVPMAFAEVTT